MARTVNLLVDPCGTANPPRYQLAERQEIPKGSVLGLLDNGKTNVGLILDQIGDALMRRFGFAEVLHIRKPGTAHPCPEDRYKELESRCAVVVNGVGD